MLEDRPIVQRSLIGFGAFSFVFAAAMAGSAFMISGGLGFGGDDSRAPTRDYASAETVWDEFASPIYAATPVYVTPPQAAPTSGDEYQRPASYYPAEDLDGESPPSRDVRTEEDILRDIHRELAAQQAEQSRAQEPEPAYSEEPAYDAAIVAAKEQAANGYGNY